MERLTVKHHAAAGHYTSCCPEMGKIINRLGAYEDTGLEPEVCANYKRFEDEAISRGITFRRLVELMEAEQDGRLVVLPAKTVFELGYFPGKKCDGNCPVLIDGRGCCDFCDNSELAICKVRCRQDHIPNIGKTVFLTCDDAEAALEAQKGCGER